VRTPAFTRKKRGLCFALLSTTSLLVVPIAAQAIPSPELVIGSVSSLSQVFAVGLAMISGAGALVAAKLGFKPQTTRQRYPLRLISVLLLIVTVLAAANYWQFNSHKNAE
jgi:amino acid permease